MTYKGLVLAKGNLKALPITPSRICLNILQHIMNMSLFVCLGSKAEVVEEQNSLESTATTGQKHACPSSNDSSKKKAKKGEHYSIKS